MNFDKYTIKTQQALQKASSLAVQNGQQIVGYTPDMVKAVEEGLKKPKVEKKEYQNLQKVFLKITILYFEYLNLI